MHSPEDPIWSRWEDVDRVLKPALELSGPEREAWVGEACGHDEELRRAVLSVLAAAEASEGMFEGPDPELSREAVEAFSGGDGAASWPVDPERVGGFRILRRLGRGGMGTVYLAERDGADFHQQVAVKVLRRGIDTEDAIRRFVEERRILARLEHPGIARLLDGGATDDGRPYLAMEYVEGTPITVHCDARDLTVRQRLDLFLEVAEAVRFAHTSLVVHRDLKPSNILVDGAGRVRLLDFGIAKILGDDDQDAGLRTRTGRALLTPGCASPEQLRGEPVTTASDVYALGALLYVLLSGQAPHDLKGLSHAEMVAKVGDAVPLPPSAAATRVARGPRETEPADRARRRGTTSDRLRRTLRGDLDTIVLKALHPDPQRRYATVDSLAADVRRWLDGLTVSARPDGWGYRARRFAARHRWAVATTAVVVIGSAAGLAAHTIRLGAERDRARLEAAKAERVTEFLTSIFEQADPGQARGEEVTAVELLNRGAGRIETELADEPEVRARLLSVIGGVYRGLNLYETAAETLASALALQTALYDGPHPEVARTRLALARSYRRIGRLDEAVELGDAALADWRVLEPTPGFGVAESLLRVGNLHHLRGDHRAGAPYFEELLPIVDTLPREPRPELVEILHYAAQIKSGNGHLDEALALQTEALEMATTVFGEVHPLVGDSLDAMGAYLSRAGRAAEAEDHARRALEVARALHPDGDHSQVAVAEGNLAFVLYTRGRPADAEPLMRASIRRHRDVEGDESLVIGQRLHQLADIRLARGDALEAESLYRESIRFNDARFGPASSMTLQAEIGLAFAQVQADRAQGAGSLFRALASRLPESPRLAYRYADVFIGEGAWLVRRGQAGEAEARLRAGLRVLEDAQPPVGWKIAEARGWLGEALLARGEYAEAEPLLLDSHRVLDGLPQLNPALRAAARQRLSTLYRALGDEAQARRYAAR